MPLIDVRVPFVAAAALESRLFGIRQDAVNSAVEGFSQKIVQIASPIAKRYPRYFLHAFPYPS